MVGVRGNTQAAQALLAEQVWVRQVAAYPEQDQVSLQVTVMDEEKAEEQLLPLLVCHSDCQVTVLEFSRKKYELEEIFMDIVEGNEHGHR